MIFGAKCQGTISDVHIARRICLMQEVSDAQRRHNSESLHLMTDLLVDHLTVTSLVSSMEAYNGANHISPTHISLQ